MFTFVFYYLEVFFGDTVHSTTHPLKVESVVVNGKILTKRKAQRWFKNHMRSVSCTKNSQRKNFARTYHH